MSPQGAWCFTKLSCMYIKCVIVKTKRHLNHVWSCIYYTYCNNHWQWQTSKGLGSVALGSSRSQVEDFVVTSRREKNVVMTYWNIVSLINRLPLYDWKKKTRHKPCPNSVHSIIKTTVETGLAPFPQKMRYQGEREKKSKCYFTLLFLN